MAGRLSRNHWAGTQIALGLVIVVGFTLAPPFGLPALAVGAWMVGGTVALNGLLGTAEHLLASAFHSERW